MKVIVYTGVLFLILYIVTPLPLLTIAVLAALFVTAYLLGKFDVLQEFKGRMKRNG